MDLIERLFGMSPDGGSGATELAVLLGVTLLVAFLSWRRSVRPRSEAIRRN
jgi:hypothetical protein